MRRIALCSLVATLGLLAIGGPAPSASARPASTAALPTFRLVDLGVLPNDDISLANGINEAGDVVGWSRGESGLDGLPSPFVYTDAAGMQPLPLLPGGTAGMANEINDLGDVVGHVTTTPADDHAVRWPAAGGVEPLGSLGPPAADLSSYATSTNERRDVTGWSYITPQVFQGLEAFLYRGGQMRSITPGARPAFGQDINENRQVSGEYEYDAFVWTAGAIEFVGGSLAGNTNGEAINDEGQVAITQTLPDRNNAWRWTPGIGIESLGLNSTNEPTTAHGINSSGDVVGRGSVPSAPAIGAYLFTDATGPLYLTGRLEPGSSDWYVSEAFDINDGGQIVGIATNFTTFDRHAVRLDPVATPPPCEADCLRVTNLHLSGRYVGNRVEAMAKLLVADEAGVPVSGASVDVEWTLPNGRKTRATVTTNANGVAQHAVESRRGTYVFAVLDVTKAGSTFDPANSELTDTITRP